MTHARHSRKGKPTLSGSPLTSFRKRTWKPRVRNPGPKGAPDAKSKTYIYMHVHVYATHHICVYNCLSVYIYAGDVIHFPAELKAYGLTEEVLLTVFGQACVGQSVCWKLKSIPVVSFYQTLHKFLKKWPLTKSATKSKVLCSNRPFVALTTLIVSLRI